MSFPLKMFALVACCIVLVSCQNQKTDDESPPSDSAHLGEINLQVTGTPAAQQLFTEGLLLLHSFEYADSRKQFIKAQEEDPEMVMAYWGEAMTHHASLWARQNKEKALTALNKLAQSPEERLGKAETELEKDFLMAANILFGEGTKLERDQAYSKQMEKLHKKYPKNHEVSAFYSLSLLGSVPEGRDVEVYGKGAVIAQSILDENAQHPGALHYLIHSYDDPEHAHLALKAANSYSVVAPDATHALHMPSHIYVALGMWDEVINSNIASYQASVNRMERLDLDDDARSYHALHWLEYGLLQKEKNQEALDIVHEMVNYTESVPTKGARAYLINMKGGYLIETEDWSSDIKDIEVDYDDLNISQKATMMYLDGYEAYLNADADELKKQIHMIEQERIRDKRIVEDSGLPMCNASGWTSDIPNQTDLDQAEVMEIQLKGFSAWMQDDTTAGGWFTKASELEQSISYMYGPPEIVNPSFEVFGFWLLEQGRAKEAIEQFDYALGRGTKRMRALEGKKKAAKMMGDDQLVASVQGIIDEILTSDLTESTDD